MQDTISQGINVVPINHPRLFYFYTINKKDDLKEFFQQSPDLEVQFVSSLHDKPLCTVKIELSEF